MSLITRAGRHARANVVAYVALFVALGGTSAYAVNTIGSADIIDESIQSVDIKNAQVKAADIGGTQITTSKIYPGSVTNSDIGTDAVTPVTAMVDWDPNGAGYRRASIVSNNSGALASESGPALPSPAYTSQQVSGIERLAAGRIVRVEVLQGSGGDLNVRLSRFQMTLVGGY